MPCREPSHGTDEEIASWQERIARSQNKRPHRRNIVDDGFYSSMAVNASFETLLELPRIEGPKALPEFSGAVPFSLCGARETEDDCVVFFEKDPLFADVLVAADDFLDELSTHPCVASPDCSLYYDMPFVLQMANLYLSRLVGHYFEEKGLCVIPTVRWGDERTYRPYLTPEPIAFATLPKEAAYWIGPYGVSKRREDRLHFHNGLRAMISYLRPQRIYAYGAIPQEALDEFGSCIRIIPYPNWIKRAHEAVHRG